jgi:hypothetical protein
VIGEETFLARVAAIRAAAAELSPLAAGILAALEMEIAADSRSFARQFGIAHALALRAVSELTMLGFIEIRARDPHSQRTHYSRKSAGSLRH